MNPEPRTPNPEPHYHVVGVAGVGMSAVAQVLRATGAEVSGSDRYLDQGRDLDVLRKLSISGVELVPQDGSGVKPTTKAVVVSTAVEADNPDLAAAARLDVPVIHRAAMLAEQAAGRCCLAVSGTSGKTTVTGMVGWILEYAGMDPTVVNGGAVINWRTDDTVGNVRPGGSDLWVLEADESDRSLLAFTPETAVVTNISKDHFELDEVVDLFRTFAGRVTGTVICGAGVREMLHSPGARAEFIEEDLEPWSDEAGSGFRYGEQIFAVPLIGRHNIENAFVAVVTCERLGVELKVAAEALRSFQGIERRLEVAGEVGGIKVIDDYAHNPAKIAAAWSAAASGGSRVLGAWRPHGFGPLAAMQDELSESFSAVCRADDRLYILPVYYAGGTATRAVTSETFVERLQAAGVPAVYAPGYDMLLEQILETARPGDVVLSMGARDPELPLLARRLAQSLEG